MTQFEDSSGPYLEVAKRRGARHRACSSSSFLLLLPAIAHASCAAVRFLRRRLHPAAAAAAELDRPIAPRKDLALNKPFYGLNPRIRTDRVGSARPGQVGSSQLVSGRIGAGSGRVRSGGVRSGRVLRASFSAAAALFRRRGIAHASPGVRGQI